MTTLDVYETRRENLNRLLKEPGSKTQLATRLGTSQSHITHLLKPPTAPSSRAIREETARAIEEIMGLEHGRLDQPDLVLYRQGHPTQVIEIKKSPARQLAEHTDTFMRASLQPAAAPAKDAALLEEAFKLVLESLQERQLQLPADKTAKMARLVYEQGRATGRIDPSLVLSLLSLMA
jgi:hypothetical protein